jgi:galactokinase
MNRGHTSDAQAIAEQLRAEFRRMFGGEARVFRAPGRVNLIGEHTDYNDGFVMPMAIELATWIAAAARDDARLRVFSDRYAETAELPFDRLDGPPRHHWSDYVRGVAAVLRERGCALRGADLYVHGQIPPGAGLSSSASLEIAAALALEWIAQCSLEPAERARACQRAEHEYAGTRCGIMDQFAATFARAGSALLLDCRTLEFRHVALPAGAEVVVCNSGVKHALAAGEYNRRRADCEAGVRAIARLWPGVRALRDVTPEQLEAHRDALPPQVYRRCRHVVTENERVLRAAEALATGDAVRFGELMYASHASLRDDYEVSCAELDLLVELAAACGGVLGARMTGGGFGGCTVNLVRADAVEEFRRRVAQEYERKTGIAPGIISCAPAAGAGAC